MYHGILKCEIVVKRLKSELVANEKMNKKPRGLGALLDKMEDNDDTKLDNIEI